MRLLATKDENGAEAGTPVSHSHRKIEGPSVVAELLSGMNYASETR